MEGMTRPQNRCKGNSWKWLQLLFINSFIVNVFKVTIDCLEKGRQQVPALQPGGLVLREETRKGKRGRAPGACRV